MKREIVMRSRNHRYRAKCNVALRMSLPTTLNKMLDVFLSDFKKILDFLDTFLFTDVTNPKFRGNLSSESRADT